MQDLALYVPHDIITWFGKVLMLSTT